MSKIIFFHEYHDDEWDRDFWCEFFHNTTDNTVHINVSDPDSQSIMALPVAEIDRLIEALQSIKN